MLKLAGQPLFPRVDKTKPVAKSTGVGADSSKRCREDVSTEEPESKRLCAREVESTNQDVDMGLSIDPNAESESDELNLFDSASFLHTNLFESLQRRKVVDAAHVPSKKGHSVLADITNSIGQKPVQPKRTPLSPPRKIKQCLFLTKPGGTSGYAFKENNEHKGNVTPETKRIMRKEAGSPLKVRRNANGSPYKAYAPNGSKLRLSMKVSNKDGDVYTFASEAHSGAEHIYNKQNRSDEQPFFQPHTRLSSSIVLTKERLAKFEGVRKTWKIDQKQAMGGVTAKEAAVGAGVDAKGSYHWMHLFAFSMGGFDGQEPNEAQNLFVGTDAANGQHLVMEETAKSLVTKHGSIVVAYDIDKSQDVFDSEWHVYGQVTYQIYGVKQELLADYNSGKVGEGEVKGALLASFRIDALNPSYAHTTDRNLIQKFAYANNLRSHGFVSTDDY